MIYFVDSIVFPCAYEWVCKRPHTGPPPGPGVSQSRRNWRGALVRLGHPWASLGTADGNAMKTSQRRTADSAPMVLLTEVKPPRIWSGSRVPRKGRTRRRSLRSKAPNGAARDFGRAAQQGYFDAIQPALVRARRLRGGRAASLGSVSPAARPSGDEHHPGGGDHRPGALAPPGFRPDRKPSAPLTNGLRATVEVWAELW